GEALRLHALADGLQRVLLLRRQLAGVPQGRLPAGAQELPGPREAVRQVSGDDVAPSPDFRAVIMAGGQGQRFWPLSTPDRPKQFLDLGKAGRTLIQQTYDRVLPLAGSPANVYVATARRYVGLVCEQLPDVPVENLLVEPTSRDSAPAIALACLTIAQRHGDVVTGFFSSDHR